METKVVERSDSIRIAALADPNTQTEAFLTLARRLGLISKADGRPVSKLDDSQISNLKETIQRAATMSSSAEAQSLCKALLCLNDDTKFLGIMSEIAESPTTKVCETLYHFAKDKDKARSILTTARIHYFSQIQVCDHERLLEYTSDSSKSKDLAPLNKHEILAIKNRVSELASTQNNDIDYLDLARSLHLVSKNF